MADVRVTSGGDRRVTSAGDVRVTDSGLITFATLDQRVQKVFAAATVATLDQQVSLYYPAADVVTLAQYVRLDPVSYPAATVATLDQTLIVYSVSAAATIATLDQRAERVYPAATVATLRQTVLSVAQIAANPVRIYLDGADITDRCSPDLTITAAEASNRTARVIYRPPSGSIDIPGYQGREVDISRIQGGSIVPLFFGVIDVPTYDRYARTLTLACSDLRSERLGKEDQPHLLAMTGGRYSTLVQAEDAEGERWVRELMRTVPGSLDYTSAGVLRYRGWAVGPPTYTLTADQIHHRNIALSFADRSELVNRVNASVEYRYFRRNTLSYAVSLTMRESEFCSIFNGGCTPLFGDIVPLKQALAGAGGSVSNWSMTSLEFQELPSNGWFRGDDAISKIQFGVTDAFRATRAMGADYQFERYLSQPKRERYSMVIEAPQSIEQYGVVPGDTIRTAAETRIDGSIFEERGCVITADPDDRRGDVNTAIQAMQDMAKRQILEAHRKNEARLRYKPKRGASGYLDLLPVEIGDTISASSDEVNVTGFVSGIEHRTSREGDIWTDLVLSVSRVSSALSVTEDWSLPAQPASYRLNSDSQSLPSTPDCPAPAGDAEVTGTSRLEPDGSVVIVTPSVSKAKVDEIIGERVHTYPVAIPNDPYSVEVPQ